MKGIVQKSNLVVKLLVTDEDNPRTIAGSCRSIREYSASHRDNTGACILLFTCSDTRPIPRNGHMNYVKRYKGR